MPDHVHQPDIRRIAFLLRHHDPPAFGAEQHLRGTRASQAMTVLAGAVEIEFGVRLLDDRDFQPVFGKRRQHGFDQCGFAHSAGLSADSEYGNIEHAKAPQKVYITVSHSFSVSRLRAAL